MLRNKTSRTRILALVATLALLAAACGDATEGDEAIVDPTPSPAAADETPADEPDAPADETPTEPLTASWTGVTEDTIRLGFTTSDLVELKAMGLVDLDRGDPQQVLDALIADVNDRGGIHGRLIEAHLEVLLPIDATAADAACVRMTEDDPVFAVLAPFVGPNTTLNPCINDTNETIIVGGAPTPSQLEISRAPWLSDRMFSDRRLRGVVQLLEEAGLLGDIVGVSVTAEEQSVANEIVIPALQELGKEIVDVVLSVEVGDQLAAATAWETFIERFRVEGVDSVVMVENTGTFGATELARSGLDAEYLIVDSNALVSGIGRRGEIDNALLNGVIGSGGASEDEEWELAATQDCVRVFEAAHPDITVVPTSQVAEGDSDWLGNIMIFCAPLRLFEQAATAAGPVLTHESFLAGAESLGEIELPGQVFASIAPGKYDAADAIRLTEFDSTVHADGAAVPFGPLTAVN